MRRGIRHVATLGAVVKRIPQSAPHAFLGKPGSGTAALHAMMRRWGDGPLRWMQCLLFLDLEHEVHQFADFWYEHYRTFDRKIVCRECATARDWLRHETCAASANRKQPNKCSVVTSAAATALWAAC